MKCPTENIPTELIVDSDGLDIGTSIKISSIKLPENVVPTIQGRDFVIATLAAPTVIKEPEKPAEAEAGEEGAETSAEGTEGEEKSAAGSDGEKKDSEKSEKKDGEDKKPSAKGTSEKK